MHLALVKTWDIPKLNVVTYIIFVIAQLHQFNQTDSFKIRKAFLPVESAWLSDTAVPEVIAEGSITCTNSFTGRPTCKTYFLS